MTTAPQTSASKKTVNAVVIAGAAHGSAFQVRILEVICKHELNGSVSLTEIAVRLKASRLAVNSALRSMERRGLAGYFRSPPGDQWSAQMWYLKTPNAPGEPLPPERDSQRHRKLYADKNKTKRKSAARIRSTECSAAGYEMDA